MGTEHRVTPKRPTIRDVAERAGVSKSLVSLVIHDSPRVSDKSRLAVHAAIDELGYRPSAAARGLVNQRSGLVGIVMSGSHDVFYAEILDGVSSYLTENRFDMVPIILHGGHHRESESRAIDQCLELRTECLMLMGSALAEDTLDRIGREVPLVIVGRRISSEAIDVVSCDDQLGAELATKHLLDLGHRHIAHITGGNGNGASEREAGYREMMGQAGFKPTIIVGGYDMGHGTEAGRRLLDEREDNLPTAVVASNDLVAIGLMDVLRKGGVRIPDDVSIIGYDDIVLAGLDSFALTTISQSIHQMGETVARLVCQRALDPEQRPQTVLIDPALVVRSTTRAI